MRGKSAIIIVIVLVILIAGAAVGYFALAPQVQDEAELESIGVSTLDGSDEMAPDFIALNQDGEEVSLSSFEGKPVILNFWTSWCTYCKQEMADFENAYGVYGADIDFVILNATTDSKETIGKAESYIDDKGFNLPFYFDTTGQASSLYRITAYPTTYFIDAEGCIVGYHPGLLDAETLDKACQILLGNY